MRRLPKTGRPGFRVQRMIFEEPNPIVVKVIGLRIGFVLNAIAEDREQLFKASLRRHCNARLPGNVIVDRIPNLCLRAGFGVYNVVKIEFD